MGYFNAGAVVAGAVLLVMVVGLGLHLYPCFGADDPDALGRLLIVRIVSVCVGVYLFAVSIIAIDLVTPGDWMKKVYEEPMACSVVMGAVVVAVGFIWVYG